MKNNDAIFNTIDNGIIILDEALNIVAWNYWLEIRTDIKSKDIVGKNICEEFSYINKRKLKRKIKAVLVTNNPSYYSVDPHQYLIDIKINSILNVIYESMQQDITIVPYDKDERKVCLYIYDKTSLCETNYKLEQLNKELVELSNLDPLTKIYNRRYFSEFSKKMLALAVRESHSVSIITLDIDFFKNVNDTYGHSVGDEVLIKLAQTLSNGLRECDIVARFGGEEFVVFLYHVSLNSSEKVAEKMRLSIENIRINTNLGVLKITASFGVTEYDPIQDNSSIELTLKRADDALYEAKKNGRNQVRICV